MIMDIEYKTSCGRISGGSRVLSDRPTKMLRYTLLDSVQGQSVNVPTLQSSVTGDVLHGAPNLRCQSSLLGQPACSHILTHKQSHCSESSDKHLTRHGSLQSSLCNNDSLQVQSPVHECPQHTGGHSVQCSPSNGSCLSGGSPASSQISQTFPSDSQTFQSADSGYNDNEQPSGLKNVLHELETVLLGPDNNGCDNSEGSNEDTGFAENSEWSLEALNSVTGIMYSEPEEAKIPRAKQNEHQLPNTGSKSVKAETGSDMEFCTNIHFTKSSPEEQKEVLDFQVPQDDVRQLLVACAKFIGDGDKVKAEKYIAALRQVVSVSGDPMQRLGAYMVEGLVARLASSGGNIYKSLKCKEVSGTELLSHMRVLYEICPYYKFGYLAANGAIAEAFRDENRVHIIDFQISQGSQWVTLIQALAARPGGPPSVRITGIDDPVGEYVRGGGLQTVGESLSKLAESCKVPFEFHAVPAFGPDVQRDMLEVRSGETVAVNFAFQLHHMPDESVNTSNHRDRLLRMVKGMSPKVVTLVEQEANTNTAPFFPRFMETLSYYTAMFESLDLSLPRDNKKRINAEQHCLARDIVNVIACEGADRVERHEVLGKWKARFTMAGFRPYPLSSYVNSAIKSLMGFYSENYRLVEKDAAVYLGWLDRHLIVASAWQ
uniref:Uncharacterized protein n=1 Tax=Araucaria cunninghamii TaxID=56994 RepID=A0A0D6QZI2_ARACU